MRFKKISIKIRRKNTKKWHKWFAWHPIRINEYTMCWLETVLRSGETDYVTGDDYHYKYKTLNI